MKRFAGLAVAIAALVFAAPPVAAQGADGAAVQFRFGGFFPSGNSAFWDASEFYFTLDESDFNDIILGGSWLTPLNNHLEIGFNIDFYDATVLAADAQFEDEIGNPILHDTSLSMIPMTVDLRIYPAGRNAVRGSGGRIQVRRPSFYVGGGAGMNLWEYEEVGDFVAGDLTIYFDQLKDDGVAFEAHLLAGVELPVSPAWSLNFEGRYSWSEATPSGPFAVFDQGDLDLGGASGFFGATLRF